MKKVGILGAGQLGCMLADSLFKFGAEVYFYDTHKNAPGAFRTPHFFCGEWNDKEQLTAFFSACDVVTYEFENVSVELLDSIVQNTRTPLYPSAKVLEVTQNRISEKNFLLENNLPVCQFTPIFNKIDLQNAFQSTFFPCILKTATGGYDGKGQWKLNSIDEAKSLMPQIISEEKFPLILEEFIPIYKEVSCVIARNKKGETAQFPVFENEHRNHILYQTLLPAEISKEVEAQVQKIAKEACHKLNVTGLLTTEFFISQKNKIYVNEFAPRPHNSAHITNIACSISQFDMFARILLDIPISNSVLHQNFYCMGNILGDIYIKQGHSKNLNLNSWNQNPDIIEIRLYGKERAVEKRKMGHFIAVHNSRNNAIAAAEKLRKDLDAPN
ncbi:MAG: 5-(carboxyamino)imidazole ribonucleotide synthase [Bdellovibrionota bacterium]